MIGSSYSLVHRPLQIAVRRMEATSLYSTGRCLE